MSRKRQPAAAFGIKAASETRTSAAASEPDESFAASGWSRNRRLVVSGLIAFHVFAVFLAPFASPPPASELAQATARLLQPYLKGVAIDNGYRFFAPEPVPSHLVRYEIEMENGEMIGGRFPDPKLNWPRLMYHRHFMLAESLFNLVGPVAELPVGGFRSDEEREQFDRDRGRADALRYSVASYLLRQHPNSLRVQLYAVMHEIPSPDYLRQGFRLDDPQLYFESSLGVFTNEDIRRSESNAAAAVEITPTRKDSVRP